MIEVLNKKHILLIMPKFFGYDRVIETHLKSAGAIVTLIYEDMDEVSYFYRFINAYFPKKMPNVMNRYYLKQVLPIANKLDYVLLIRGEFLNPEVLKTLKKHTPKWCKYCMYQWDSVENNRNSLKIAPYFDAISTFDPFDANKFNWNYRPLFYIPEFIKHKEKKIDVLYSCSIHSKRIEILNKIKKLCDKKKLRLFKHVYSKKIIFYKRKYLDRRDGYIIADNKDISSVKMDVSDTYKLYNVSKIVVDYTHPGQNGLTMRTIESFGCGNKLVTNNHYIINTDFYNPNNIFIYEDENIDIPDEFISGEYCKPNIEVYAKYSLDSWIISIMNLAD